MREGAQSLIFMLGKVRLPRLDRGFYFSTTADVIPAPEWESINNLSGFSRSRLRRRDDNRVSRFKFHVSRNSMFTGIIRYQGKITKRTGKQLVISAPRALVTKLRPGGSLAVNGVCLTVESRIKNQELRISVMPETLRVTTLGKLPIGSRVNLELPLKLSDALDGHFVQGHVDGVGRVTKILHRGKNRVLQIAFPRSLARLVAPKGSIAVDGVSLTVISADKKHFTVGLIPETLRRTTLGTLRVGDAVNLEADMIARYLTRMMNVKFKNQNAK